MLKPSISLLLLLSFGAFADNALFPEADQVDPLIRYQKNSKLEVAPDGTLRVNGKIHYFLSAQISMAHPWANTLKVPGVPEALGWLYNKYPDYDSLQRVGFDFIGTSVPPYFLKEYSKTVNIDQLKDTPVVRAEQKQLWQSGLPVYIDITCFEWMRGCLAYGWMGCKQSDIPEEARNTRYRTAFNRWAPYSFMHPAGREIYRKMWTETARFAKKHGTKILAYELFNEAGYNDPSDYNRKLFAGYLKKKYKNPEEMNRLWKSSYASFEAASRFKDQKENLGLFVEWGKFMEECAVDLCTFGQAEIRKIDPGAYVTNQINGGAMYRTISVNNFNMYQMSKVLNAVAYPTGGANTQPAGLRREPVRTLDAPDFVGQESLAIYAYYKVLAEGKPLFNDENYGTGRSLFNAVWQDAIHHSSATNFWAWASGIGRLRPHERNIKGMQDSAKKFSWELLNPFAFSTERLTEFAPAKKEIAKFGEFFLPRDRGIKTETAVLLSYPTSRRIGFRSDLPDAHLMPFYNSALVLSHYPTDVIAEEHLAEGRADRYKVIVAAGVSNTMPGTVMRLMEFVRRGGILILGRTFPGLDEYDNPNLEWNSYPGWKIRSTENPAAGYAAFETRFRSGVLPGDLKGRLSLTPSFEGKWEEIGQCGGRGALFRKAFGKGYVYFILPELRMYPLAALLGGILERHQVRPSLAIANANGTELPPNIELHVSKLNGKHAAFLFNYDSYPKLLTLKPERKSAAFDLISRKKLPETKHGFLYLLPPQSRGIVAFGPESLYKEFGPFTPISEDGLRTEKRREEEKLEQKRRAVKTQYSPDPTRTRAIDLRPFCNREYVDNKAGDGLGGWSDEGRTMSLDHVPLYPEVLDGVLCDFIRPDMNEYKTCIVLKSTRGKNTALPEAVRGIPVHAKVKNLYFFHTTVWAEKNKQVLTYRIHYADGKSLDLPVRVGKEIGDWYLASTPVEQKNRIAWSNSNGHGFFLWQWKNPRPETEIRSLDILSANGSTVPIVLGITMEEAGSSPLTPISSAEEFDAFFIPEPHYLKTVRHKILLEPTDGHGLRIRTQNSNSGFLSRRAFGKGTVSLELLNESAVPRITLSLLQTGAGRFSLSLNFKERKGFLAEIRNGKEVVRKEFGVPAVKAGTPYLLTGTYTGKSVQFKLNGTLLAELPAPSGARGKIVLQQNWWTSVCIRGIGFDAE